MIELINQVYREYYRKLQELRAQELPTEDRSQEELKLWNETEEKLAAAWERQGKVLH